MVKFEVGEIKIPILNLCTLIYEVDLYTHWFPFCKTAHDRAKIHECKKLASSEFWMAFPFNNRDGNFVGFGVNRLHKDGTLLLAVRSSDYNFEEKKQREYYHGHKNPPQGKHVNMIATTYGFEMTPISEDSFSLRIVMRVNPQIHGAPAGIRNAL
jgi:hypothetical protein